MNVVANPLTVSDYADAVRRKKVRINSDYQRHPGIWSVTAKSFLIETLVNGFPIPALYLHHRYDEKTRKPYREIVDGQQRTDAIAKFMADEFRLSRTLATKSLAGRRYSELNDEDVQSLQTYILPVFLLLDATEADVREAFRRINSYSARLNAEEKRHAKYQGSFKWFVNQESLALHGVFLKWETFTKSQLNRMKDNGLISEVLFALKNGIKTTKSGDLDKMYSSLDDDEEYDGTAEAGRIEQAVREVDGWEFLPATALAKPHQLLLLLIAVMHVQRTVPKLKTKDRPGGKGVSAAAERRLAELAEALDNPDDVVAAHEADDDAEDVDLELAKYIEVVRASDKGTNVRESRVVRFNAFYDALTK